MGRRRRTIDSTVATLLHLPPEICGLICDLVERKTLLQLSRVSRSFCDQAQRIIYHTVDLRSNAEALSSWCRAVSRNPKLGGYIRRLTVSSSELVAGSDDAAKVTRALKKCPNLKRLAVHADVRRWRIYACNEIQTWIVGQGPFRLTHFSNSHFRNSFLHAFWNKQTGIQLLSLPLVVCGPPEAFPCREDQLPNLVALEVASTDLLPTTARPLKRIQIRLNHLHTPRELSRLSLFSATLTTLNLCDIALRSASITIATIARAVPNLVHLGITERLPHYPEEKIAPCTVQESPGATLAHLNRLKTFVLYTYHIDIFVDARNNRNYSLSDPKAVAELFMEICPHLEEVIVGGYVERVVDEIPFMLEETCKLVRGENTRGVTVELGTGYDFAAVGRFWDV
ncbi:hypothetical protein C8F01DRAFT_718939 [Mycena amicta]|nr:hypothetical protein C8F01DRAFT_718939 [Mycena amicta]